MEYTDYNTLSDGLNYIYMQMDSSDGWCLGKITYMANDIANEWRSCDFDEAMGMFVFDYDCSTGGFIEASFDLTSDKSICYDDSPPTSYPTSYCFILYLFLIFVCRMIASDTILFLVGFVWFGDWLRVVTKKYKFLTHIYLFFV